MWPCKIEDDMLITDDESEETIKLQKLKLSGANHPPLLLMLLGQYIEPITLLSP
jgi:hypothetical protein